MALFRVILKPSVEKDLHSLPKSVVVRVIAHLEQLKNEPLPRQAVKLEGGKACIACGLEIIAWCMASIRRPGN